ncbi:hypothetical protein GCM10010363_61170 [Streptomyces omiyaensis]|nr:hypothetical protein GCM10010363_61170 [Streptomyces omiyaensis]
MLPTFAFAIGLVMVFGLARGMGFSAARDQECVRRGEGRTDWAVGGAEGVAVVRDGRDVVVGDEEALSPVTEASSSRAGAGVRTGPVGSGDGGWSSAGARAAGRSAGGGGAGEWGTATQPVVSAAVRARTTVVRRIMDPTLSQTAMERGGDADGGRADE